MVLNLYPPTLNSKIDADNYAVPSVSQSFACSNDNLRLRRHSHMYNSGANRGYTGSRSATQPDGHFKYNSVGNLKYYWCLTKVS